MDRSQFCFGELSFQNMEQKKKGGKGVYDLKAATFKGDVGRYVNGGNDVINALQLKTAIESGQGTTGVRASYVAAKA